jgi:predicted ribonuclease YlaK
VQIATLTRAAGVATLAERLRMREVIVVRPVRGIGGADHPVAAVP